MSNVKNIWHMILGMPKTIYFNLVCFGIDGLIFPCILSDRVKLISLRGGVKIDGSIHPGMIKIGFPGVELFDDKRLRLMWINNGLITFKGKASIRNGCAIRNNGNIVFGSNFHVSSPSTFICYNNISFGDDCLVGWNCQFSDGDAHKIINIEDGNVVNPNKGIDIGNHVWFGAFCRVYKGITIKNDCVIAANTVLTRSFSESNCVIGGSPNKILKRNITWLI